MSRKRLGPIPKTIGKRLRDLRQARGLTQGQLAGDDFTKGFISLVENGRSRVSMRSAAIFAERLRVPLTALLDQREQSRLSTVRDALEHARELCDETEAFVQSRRALIDAALEQYNAYSEMQRKLVEVTLAGVKKDPTPRRTRRDGRAPGGRRAPADARG